MPAPVCVVESSAEIGASRDQSFLICDPERPTKARFQASKSTCLWQYLPTQTCPHRLLFLIIPRQGSDDNANWRQLISACPRDVQV